MGSPRELTLKGGLLYVPSLELPAKGFFAVPTISQEAEAMKYLFAVLAVFAVPSLAEWSVCGTEELLPIGFTDEELLRLDEIGMYAVPTSPPPAGSINPGEFAPATGVFVRWPLGLPAELLVDFSQDSFLWVICTSAQQSAANSYMQTIGCDMGNVGYINAVTNSIWVRDYGPWFIVLPDGTQGIFDYVYNRPRPDDDLFPGVVGSTWDIPVYSSTIVHTGGNYMSSGFDQAMSTTMVYSENGGDEEWVNGQMEDYLGITNYLCYPDPQGSYINHIDCWAKMLSPDRIIILQVPPSHPDYAALEAVADLIAATPCPYGTPWNVYRVQSSGEEGYTNSLISNNVVYLPVWDTDNDSAAYAMYQEAMPGYTIQAYPYSGWDPTDALHCRTRNVIDNEMLMVSHIPVAEWQSTGSPVVINAFIRCHPDNSLLTHDLCYRTGGSGPFTLVSMTAAGADSFTAQIPGLPDGTSVEYYVTATDDSGRQESIPRFAPETWFFEYETTSTGIGEDPGSSWAGALTGASPNPFTGSVRLTCSPGVTGTLPVTVMDLTGRIVDSASLVVERGAVTWTPQADLPSGLYVLRSGEAGIDGSLLVTLVR
jgi:agmatine deiminase